METAMFRSQVMVVLAFCACGLLFAAEPETPAKQTDKGSGSLGDIPVPKDHTRLLKTFSPDKKLFAIFFRDGFDKIISIHDAASGKQLRYMTGHGDYVVEFKFSDDGKLLASRCTNSDRAGWAVWDVDTGNLLMRLPETKAAKPTDK
jgi:WD40 repeat protein